MNLPHLDAAENIFFQRELEQILTESYDPKYAALMGKIMVPVKQVNPTDERITYRMFDWVGRAKRITDMSDDLPTVNVKGSELSKKVYSYGAAFEYSIDELKASASVGRPLDRERAIAARKTVDLQVDDVIASGDSAAGLEGVLNLTGANTYSVPADGSGASAAWTAKTPDLIIRDVNGAINKVRTDSKDIEKPTRVVLPVAQYTQIATTARTDVSDTTILKFLEMNHPGVQFMSWERLTGSGDSSSDRMLVYNPTVENLHVLMAVEFEQQAPQLKNFAYKVNVRCKMGGVVAPYVKSILYADHI